MQGIGLGWELSQLSRPRISDVLLFRAALSAVISDSS